MTADALYEPLRCCRPTDAPGHVLAEMERLGFDVVGVTHGDGRGAQGYVTRADLMTSLEIAAPRPFVQPHLVSETMPIIDLVDVLGTLPRVFVLAGARVEGLVARADLHKPPVRVLLFGMISLLEMHLAYWAAHLYPADAWKAELVAARITAASALWAKRKARGDDITEFDCLQFCDKRDLVLESPQTRASLSLGSKTGGAAFLRAAERLRNDLAHSQHNLAERGSWAELATTVKQIETVLKASDAAIEARVNAGVIEVPILGLAL